MRKSDVLYLGEKRVYNFSESIVHLNVFQYGDFSARKQSLSGHTGILTAMAGIVIDPRLPYVEERAY